MNNFWDDINPILCIAPMEDVTDVAFREMFASESTSRGVFDFLMKKRNGFVTFTEFVSADGFNFGDEKAIQRIYGKLLFTKRQRPIVAQIFGANIDNLRRLAIEVERLGFDGVDINMGCPDRTVIKQGAGSALIKNSDVAVDIVNNVKRSLKNIPLSVKTRVGYNSLDDMPIWIAKILATEPSALTVHLRTKKEMSDVQAHWEVMPEILRMRDSISPNTKIIGNGDVISKKDAMSKIEKYKCDGVMVGRGLFGSPDFFADSYSTLKNKKIKMLIKHLHLFQKKLLNKKYKGFHIMKKHFKSYINGWNGAKELRNTLMRTNSVSEAIKILEHML